MDIPDYPIATVLSPTDVLCGNIVGATKKIPVSLLVAGTSVGYIPTVPTTDTDTGTAGQYSADSNRYYICNAANSWKRCALYSANLGGIYSSDGDANGVLYFAGLNFGKFGAWRNPHTAGFVTVISNGDNTGGDIKATIVDRSASAYSTATFTGGGWAGVDLGAGHSLSLNRYSYRYRSDTTTFCPTAWTFEGSNDGSTWNVVDTRTGQTPALSAWVSPTVTPTTAYRYWRVKMTGNNNNGTTHFSIGELELYGALTF